MKNLIIFALSIIIILSCKKEYKDFTTLDVTVVNMLTGELISDTLRFRTMDNQTVKKGFYNDLHQIILDEKFIAGGHYTFSFNASKDKRKVEHNYSVTVTGNYKQDKIYGGSKGQSININASNNIVVELLPLTFIKQKFKNNDCSTGTNFVLYKYHLDVPNYFLTNGWSFDGCTDFTQADFNPIPMGSVHFEWHVTRNSVTEVFHDTVYFDGGDSVLYEINY